MKLNILFVSVLLMNAVSMGAPFKDFVCNIRCETKAGGVITAEYTSKHFGSGVSHNIDEKLQLATRTADLYIYFDGDVASINVSEPKPTDQHPFQINMDSHVSVGSQFSLYSQTSALDPDVQDISIECVSR